VKGPELLDKPEAGKDAEGAGGRKKERLGWFPLLKVAGISPQNVRTSLPFQPSRCPFLMTAHLQVR
jgi:hypothetical protein